MGKASIEIGRTFLVLTLLVLCPLVCLAETENHKPNVVLLVVDALRADASSEAGPFMNDFKKEATSFNKCRTTATSTKMSITSLWTSLYVTEHGVVRERDDLPNDNVTLAEVLSQNGYATGLFTGSPWLCAEFNLEQGFTHVDSIPYLNERGKLVDGRNVNQAFEKWFKTLGDEPFFAHIHYMECHASAIDYKKYYPPIKLQTYCINGPIPEGFDSTVIDNMKKEYSKAVGIAEARVKEIISLLKESGCWDDTIVIITADHGEEFGEHGGLGHGTNLHEELMRVPLMIHHPKWKPGQYDFPVSLVDIMPTICESAGAKVESPMSGISLHRLMKEKDLRDRKLFGRAFIGFDTFDQTGVVWREYKYIYDRVHKNDTLYATESDTMEKVPLQEAPKELLHEMRSALQEQIDKSKRLPKTRRTIHKIAPEVLSKLKGIGYMQ